jgi:hypothetical protein
MTFRHGLVAGEEKGGGLERLERFERLERELDMGGFRQSEGVERTRAALFGPQRSFADFN